jgi:hypothetical protein
MKQLILSYIGGLRFGTTIAVAVILGCLAYLAVVVFNGVA